MRIALAQINPTVGDFKGNADKILNYIHHAHQKHADLVVFSEMTLFGYPANDLLELEHKVHEQQTWIKHILKRLPPKITVIFGAVIPNEKKFKKGGKPYQNAAVVARKGARTAYFAKQLLPSYDVFDETRFFEPGKITGTVVIPSIGRVAVSICEDMWSFKKGLGNQYYDHNPISNLKGTKLIVNISASPFSHNKQKARLNLAKNHARGNGVPFVYVNQVGAQDEVIFDGQSFLMDKTGKVLVQAAAWHEDLVMIDLHKKQAEYRPLITDTTEHLRQAIILGIRDFVAKTGNKNVHLGLSGGIDSSVVAALAVDALGPNQVTGLILPSPYNSPDSEKDAIALAKNLGIKTMVVSITEAYQLVTRMCGIFGLPDEDKQVLLAHQNIQSRLRGLIMMTYSNMTGSLLLSTGNKSEIAAGYCTLYGDMCGALMPIGDLVKREVYDVGRIYNAHSEVIPENVFRKAPSAELAPNQTDQDTLPPYEKLDIAVQKLIESQKPPQSSVDNWLYGVLSRTEFKRWQAPPILKISEHAFGRGRRMPIACKY